MANGALNRRKPTVGIWMSTGGCGMAFDLLWATGTNEIVAHATPKI